MNVLFKNVLEFETKSKFQAGEGLDTGAFPFYTSSSKQKKFFDTKIYDGEAIILGTGGVPSVHFESNGFATSTDCLVAKLKEGVPFNSKFVYYYLLGNIHVLAKGFKGAGLKHISKAYIENIEIPIISIEEQNRYVSYFDDIQFLIKKRISMISLLDEYIKSQFFHIFGQDYNDDERWCWYPLNELLTEILSGWSPICENFPRKVENEWAVLKQGAVTRGEFFASENKAFPGEHDQANLVTADENNVLFSRKNTKDLVGSSVFVYDNFDKLLLPDTIFKLVYQPEKISGIYLVYLFNDYNFRKKLKKLASGSASSMVNISQAKLMALTIPVPKNFELMRSFDDLAILVNNQKATLRKSL